MDVEQPVAEPVPWQRLDPRIMLSALLRMLVRLIPAAAGWWFFNTDNDTARYTVIALAVLAVLNPLGQALRYVTVRYRLTDAELQHTSGLLIRRSNRMPLHRIRTVDITAPLSNRLLGLAVLRVGTGGNAFTGGGTLSLDGLPRATALRLRSELLRRAGPDVQSDVDPRLADVDGVELQRLRWRWVVYQMTGSWLIAGPLSIVGSIFGIVSLVGGEEWVGDRVSDFVDSVPWVTWALVTLLLAVILGMAAGAVTFAEAWWGFRLVREPRGRFLATRGLLTTRSFTADEARLRGVTVSQPLVARLLGGARVTPVMTGVSLAQMMTESSTLLPTTTRDVAVRVGNVLLGEPLLDDDLLTSPHALRTHPPVARRRAVLRYLLVPALLAAALGTGVALASWPVVLLAVPAALVPLAVLAGGRYYRMLGHRLTDGHLYLRRGFVSRRTDVLQTVGVNGVHVRQTLIQRLLGLASLTVTTAAGEQGYVGVDLALADATAIAATLTGEERLLGPRVQP